MQIYRLLMLTALSLTLYGCECSEEFEQLTLGISVSADARDAYGTTTPKWNRVWSQPADKYLIGVATFGPADVAPTDDTLELYDITAAPLLLTYEARPCSELDSEAAGSCANNGGDGCASQRIDWIQAEPFEQGRRYALVHRMETGNGKPLNTQDAPVDFEGALSLVMEIEITEPDASVDVDMASGDMP